MDDGEFAITGVDAVGRTTASSASKWENLFVVERNLFAAASLDLSQVDRSRDCQRFGAIEAERIMPFSTKATMADCLDNIDSDYDQLSATEQDCVIDAIAVFLC